MKDKYEELLSLKQNNGSLDKSLFTDTLLWELFVLENKTDKEIAELFDMKVSRVTYLRKREKINKKQKFNNIFKHKEDKILLKAKLYLL